MSKIALIYSDVPDFAVGTVLDHIHVEVSGASSPAPQDVAPGTAEVTFDGLAPGSYSYTVTNVDAAGNSLGSVVSGTFSVADTGGGGDGTVTLSLVTSATATP